MKDLSPEALEVLELVRVAGEPRPSDQDRLERALARIIVAGGDPSQSVSLPVLTQQGAQGVSMGKFVMIASVTAALVVGAVTAAQGLAPPSRSVGKSMAHAEMGHQAAAVPVGQVR